MSEQERNQRPQPIKLESVDGEVRLQQYSTENAREIFDAIDSSRDHLSQFGEDTATKYPTFEAVLNSIVHPSNPQRLRMAIRSKEGQLVGGINLTPQEDPKEGEIGYWLAESSIGRGYMTRAAHTLTDYGFEVLGYRSIFGKVAEGNTASVRVLERAGYTEKERKDGSIDLFKYNGVLIGKGELEGKGIYADKDFKSGEVVIEYSFKPLTADEFDKLPDWEKQFTHTQHGVLNLYSEPERYVNHSDEPNTSQDFELQADVALRDIAKGEMITTNAKKDDI